MSQAFLPRKSALLNAGRALLTPALACVALAACGPDASPSSASDTASANPAASSAAAAARAGLEPVAPSPSTSAVSAPPANLAAAPACPKAVEPQCPAAPARSTAASGAVRETWRHVHHKHRHWSNPSVHDEQIAQERDEGAGLTERSAGGYRMEEGSREISRSIYSSGHGDERLVERGDVPSGPRCLTLCPGPHAGPRRFDAAGIDARGYLVWPGKTEY